MKDHIRAAIIPLIFLGSFLLFEPSRKVPIVVLFLAMMYGLFVGPALFIVWWKKRRSKAEYEKPVFRGSVFLTILWSGDWVKTNDSKKRMRILILSRMVFPVAFFGVAAFLFLRDLTGDPLTIFLVWLTLGFGVSTWSIIRGTIKEEKKRQTAHSHDRLSGYHAGSENADDHWKKQLDSFLEAGLIDRAEYRVLLERRRNDGYGR